MIDFNVDLNKVTDFDYSDFKYYFVEKLETIQKEDFMPDIVGISALFGTAYDSMIKLATICRTLFPNSLVVGGGFLPTNMYHQIYADTDDFHALCFGEGERPLVRLVNADDRVKQLKIDGSWITKDKSIGEDSSRVGRGLVTLGQKNIKIQEFSHDLIEDLDEIPLPNYELCDLSGYSLNPTINAYPVLATKGLTFNIMTSRGCPYSCSFCAQDTVHGKKMRYQSIDRLREDLTWMKNRYALQTVAIEDDHFMGDPRRAYEILGMLIDMGLTAFFPNSLALYALKKPMLERIKAVGTDQLVLAVESGSYEVLQKIMRKPLNLDIVKRVTSDCREIGIYTDCNLVIGQPGETVEHLEESRLFLRSTYANWFRPNVATPITGSELLAKSVDGGYLKGDFTHCDYKKAIIETEHFTEKGLQSVVYLFNLELNFVYNSDLRLGNYDTALIGFNNAIQAKPDHYFAHKYASICYESLGDESRAEYHKKCAEEAYNDPFWREWKNMIDAPLSEIATI